MTTHTLPQTWGGLPKTSATIDRHAESLDNYGRRRLREVLKNMREEGLDDVSLARVVDRYRVPACIKPGIREWLREECCTLGLRWLEASPVPKSLGLSALMPAKAMSAKRHIEMRQQPLSF